MKKESLGTESKENTEAVQLSGNSGSFRERPILFNGEMVRAILDGRKTQTRRPIKPQPYYNCAGKLAWKSSGCLANLGTPAREMLNRHNIFGKPGDLLWVRETWRQFSSHEECACYDDCLCSRYSGEFLYRASSPCDEVKWRPSIHMPREACRITLRVKRVWVERVQDITTADIRAEGVRQNLKYPDLLRRNLYRDWVLLWDSIYKPNRRDGTPPWKHSYEWAANPWVWACEFELAEVKR